jgi:GTP-binding protein
VPVIATSSATGAGLGELAGELLRRVAPASASAVAGGAEPSAGVDNGHALAPPRAPGGGSEELAEHMVFRPAGDRLAAGAGFSVERLGPRSFAVRGRGIERLLARYDVDNEDAMTYVEGRLRRIGVLKALQAEGFQPGDEIEIAGVRFELDPSAPA